MAANNKNKEVQTKKPEEKKITGKIFGGTLNIRKEPDIHSERVGELADGKTVTIIETGDEWHKIKGGFIMARWVELVNDHQG